MSNYGNCVCGSGPMDSCVKSPVTPKEMALWEIFEITGRQISELSDIVNAIDNKLAGPVPERCVETQKSPAYGLIEQANRISNDLGPIISKLYRIIERL